eukprot:7017661-Prymnesium_polylepis.1
MAYVGSVHRAPGPFILHCAPAPRRASRIDGDRPAPPRPQRDALSLALGRGETPPRRAHGTSKRTRALRPPPSPPPPAVLYRRHRLEDPL